MVSIQSRSYNFPFIDELKNCIDAQDAYAFIKDSPWSFFLDSGINPYGLGRYSFIGSDPFLVLSSRGGDIQMVSPDDRISLRGNPFDILREQLNRYNIDKSKYPVPFVGGAVGYLGYDLCHFIERLPVTTRDDVMLPDCCMAFYDSVLAYDHVENRVYAIASGLPEVDGVRKERKARQRIDELTHLVRRNGNNNGEKCATRISSRSRFMDVNDSAEFSSNFKRDEYIKAVENAIEYIANGDIFQVNLSQRFESDLTCDPYDLYLRLRGINPSPFACYLNFGDVTVAGASPERFLHLGRNVVETRPMKGTRPRGRSPVEDELLEAELVKSEKDRAENIMIVDLERNDLGKVCEYGSVKVRDLCTLEKYATVFQLTSTVAGRLREDKDSIDLLKAAFPGGSVTGAPKVRAMEIIDELEPTRRGIYTGSVGYLGFDGCMDLNIVIRTFVIKGDRVYFQVGGGIVSDSDPQAEYQETLDKAQALMAALGLRNATKNVRS
jgi:para-aminobenzoate synthetase component 1